MNATPRKPNLEGLVPAFTPQRSAEAPAFNFDLRRSFQMHRTLALAVAATVFALCVAAAMLQTRQYKAQSLVYVQPTISKALGDSASSYDGQRYDSYMQQQLETLTRHDILSKALATLPPGVWQGKSESLDSAATRLSGALKVARITTSYQLSISLTAPDPAKAAAVVNAVTAAYLSEGRRDELAQTDQQAQVLGDERERILRALETARREQASLSASLGTARPGVENENPYDAGLTSLRTELAAARQAHDLAAAQLASLDISGKTRSAGLNAASDEAIGTDAGLNSLKASLSERRGKLETQMVGLTPANPVYRQDQEEIAQLDRSLEQMTESLRSKAATHLQDKLRLELARSGDLEARLNAELARQAASATGAAPKLQRAADLTADVQRMQTRLATVEDSLRGLQLENNSPGTAHLSLAAAVPVSPESGRKRILLLAALPLALLVGAFAAALARRLDGRVYIATEVEEILGFLPLAVLPAAADVTPVVEGEYMLRLAAGIEHALRVSNARTFVLTAVNVSTDIASLASEVRRQLEGIGIRTKIISSAKLLEPQRGPDQTRSTALMRTESTAALHKRHESYAISNLQQITREYDVLLVEAAPLMISAQTEYVARSADATILVAVSGVTSREELLESASLLQRLNVRGVGTVLKDVRLRFADRAYKRAILAWESRSVQQAPADFAFASSDFSTSSTPYPVPEIVEAPLAENAAHNSVENTFDNVSEMKGTPSRWQMKSRGNEADNPDHLDASRNRSSAAS